MRCLRWLGLGGVVLSLWAVAASSAPVADPGAVIEELLVASGIKQKLIRTSDRGRAWFVALTPSLGTRRAERLRSVAAETFDAATLIRRAAETFRDRYDERVARAALEGLRAPTVRIIIELELVEPSRRDVEAFGRQHGAEVSAARREMIARVDEATGASRIHLVLAVAILRGQARAHNAEGRPSLRLSQQQIEDRLREARQQLEGSVVDETRARLLYAFREVSDIELREYLAFLDSEPGAWLSRTTQQVGEQVLGANVERFQLEAIRVFSFQKRLVLD